MKPTGNIARSQVRENGFILPCFKMAKTLASKRLYRQLYSQVQPMLSQLERGLSAKLDQLELKYFKKHKRLATGCLDNEMEEKRQILEHYLKKL